MPYANRTKRRAGENKTVMALAVVGILIVVGFIVGLVALGLTNKKPDIDAVTLCDRNQPVQDVLAMLIDTTERLPLRTAKNAELQLANVISELPANSLISLYTIKSGNEVHIEPAFSMCKPQIGAEVSQFTGNKRYADKLFEERFKGPVKKAVSGLIEGGPSATSPLIESMQSAVIETFMAHDNVGQDRLVVVSDMIQNTDLLSFYGVRPSYQLHSERNLKRGQGMVKLDGVHVDLLVVPRQYPTGNRQHLIMFWTELLDAAGALPGSTMEPLL